MRVYLTENLVDCKEWAQWKCVKNGWIDFLCYEFIRYSLLSVKLINAQEKLGSLNKSIFSEENVLIC